MKQKYFVNVSEKNIYYDPYSAYNRPSSYTSDASIEKEFDSYDEAVKAAKKEASKSKEDVVIYKIASVAKFPVDNIRIEEVV